MLGMSRGIVLKNAFRGVKGTFVKVLEDIQ